jgi:hypothetical protein
MRFVVDKVALGQVFLRVLLAFPVSIIPAILDTRLHPKVALTRRTNGRSLGTFHKAVPFRKSWNIEWKSTVLSSSYVSVPHNLHCTPHNLSSWYSAIKQNRIHLFEKCFFLTHNRLFQYIYHARRTDVLLYLQVCHVEAGGEVMGCTWWCVTTQTQTLFPQHNGQTTRNGSFQSCCEE